MTLAGPCWVAVAVLGLFASGCKRGVHSRGACEGAIAGVDITGALDERSSHMVEWNLPDSPTSLKLSCAISAWSCSDLLLLERNL